MYRFANIILVVLAIFVVVGCSCSKPLCERNIQGEILKVDKLRKQRMKGVCYMEDEVLGLFVNSAAIYPDTLYRQQYTSLQDCFMEKLDLIYIVCGMLNLMPIKENIGVQLRTSEHRSMYSYVRLSIDRCTATYVLSIDRCTATYV